MTQEQKELLLKDLCARLPYEAAIIPDGQLTPYRIVDIDFNKEAIVVRPKDKELIGVGCLGFEDFKLVLRPMSSMTEEERLEYNIIKCSICPDEPNDYAGFIEWLNEHRFDFRNLIEKGLAIDCTNLNIY